MTVKDIRDTVVYWACYKKLFFNNYFSNDNKWSIATLGCFSCIGDTFDLVRTHGDLPFLGHTSGRLPHRCRLF